MFALWRNLCADYPLYPIHYLLYPVDEAFTQKDAYKSSDQNVFSQLSKSKSDQV